MTELDQVEPWLIHDGTMVTDCSAGFCVLFRCSHEAIIDRPINEIIAGEDLQALARLRGVMIMNTPADREFRQEYAFLRFDGTRFWGTSISKRIGAGRYLTRIVRAYEMK